MQSADGSSQLHIRTNTLSTSCLPPPHISSIHILCSTDTNYAAYCGVMLTSELESNPRNRFVIHILTDGLSDADTLRFHQLSARYGCIIDIHTLTPQHLSGLPERIGKWPRSICFRLFAPDLLSEEISRLIYLDCDVIVNTDLRPLWETDMDGYTCAAVNDADRCTDSALTGILSPLKSLPHSHRYFNSGVMVMDLQEMRRSRIQRSMLRLILDYGAMLPYPDQDSLNIVLSGRWKRLPCYWNLMPGALVRSIYPTLDEDEQRTVKELTSGSPRGIIHYYGPYHPWDETTLIFHPMEYLWESCRRISPWRNAICRRHSTSVLTRLHRQRLRLCWRHRIPTVYDLTWIDIPKRS